MKQQQKTESSTVVPETSQPSTAAAATSQETPVVPSLVTTAAEPEPVKTFEGGFFQVNSPVRTPKISPRCSRGKPLIEPKSLG